MAEAGGVEVDFVRREDVVCRGAWPGVGASVGGGSAAVASRGDSVPVGVGGVAAAGAVELGALGGITTGDGLLELGGGGGESRAWTLTRSGSCSCGVRLGGMAGRRVLGHVDQSLLGLLWWLLLRV